MSAAGRKPDGKDTPAKGSKANARLAMRDRRFGLIGFGAAVVILFAVIALLVGIGHPSVSDDSVAVVTDTPSGERTITQEEFDRALGQMAAQFQIPEVPEPEDPQYAELAEAAFNDLLDIAWIRGEANARGLEVSDRQVREELELVAQQNFNCAENVAPFECQEMQQLLREAGYTRQEVLDRIEVGLLSNELQNEITAEAPEPSEEQLRAFYEIFKSQFEVPATTDLRLIQTEERAEARQALRRLEEDSSDETWEEVAQEYSDDPASRDAGGLREGVTEGMFDPPVEQAINEATPGELVGPIETESGWYVIEVIERNEPRVQDFEEVREQLEQQVGQQLVAEVQTDFINDYGDKWTSRTFCAEEYLYLRCENFEGENKFLTDAAREQLEEEQAGKAPVFIDKQAWPKPPDTLSPPVNPVTISGTQIICYLAEDGQDQQIPLTGLAPAQRPHPPGEQVQEVPEGANPEDLPPTCGASDPSAMLGGQPLG